MLRPRLLPVSPSRSAYGLLGADCAACRSSPVSVVTGAAFLYGTAAPCRGGSFQPKNEILLSSTPCHSDCMALGPHDGEAASFLSCPTLPQLGVVVALTPSVGETRREGSRRRVRTRGHGSCRACGAWWCSRRVVVSAGLLDGTSAGVSHMDESSCTVG